MKQKIDLIELCKMIKDKVQPEVITVDGVEYHWRNGDYHEPGYGGCYLLADYSFKELCQNQWIEYDIPVLDEVERCYLGTILGPFIRKNRVHWVKKGRNSVDQDRIIVKLVEPTHYWGFPCFQAGEMYKNMEAGVEYTVEDLDL